MNSTLLIDIGNSRIKWCYRNNNTRQPMMALDYQQANFRQNLRTNFLEIPSPQKIVLASVGQTQPVEIVIALAQTLWPACEIHIAKTSAEKCGVKNAYQTPEKLGIDRWLALIAAHHHYPSDCWIIDCGSAITVDYILRTGQHRGGLIAPGLNMMQKSLACNTANLTQPKATSVSFLADFTEAAIYSGTLLAACGLIEKAVNHQKNERIILTGGDAGIIAPHLQVETQIDPELVLKGLAIYSQNPC
jgi:type III pantothenate kinase